MPFRFKCRECKEFIYIEELRKWQANYPCPNCNAHNFMTPKQAILNFNIEEIDEHIDCPSCNKPQNRNAIFCKDCGTEISPKELVTIAYCEKCESEYDESYQFCENDGNQLVLKEKEIDTSPKNIKSTINDNNIDEVSDLPMKWYQFLTYFSLPLTIIISMISLFFYEVERIGNIPNIIVIIMCTILFFSLHHKLIWSWKFLLASYALNSTFGQIQFLGEWGTLPYLVFVITINAAVTYPNYIYFNKRKHLFNN